MWCITGIPGSGKTTICGLLNERGIPCKNALDLPGSSRCIENGEVDIECLSMLVGQQDRDIVLEGHFSHLLGCDSVIILERAEEEICKEMENRKYSQEKISENIDALRSDAIYYEALEYLPSGRIHRIKVEEGRIDLALKSCVELIQRSKNKH